MVGEFGDGVDVAAVVGGAVVAVGGTFGATESRGSCSCGRMSGWCELIRSRWSCSSVGAFVVGTFS